MTVAELIETFRALMDDQAQPYRWEDAVVLDWLAEAETEVCIRAGLLVDEDTEEVAVLAVTAGEAWLLLSPLVLGVTRATLASSGARLLVEDPELLDRLNAGWESATGPPSGYYLEGQRLRLIPTPAAPDTLRLRVVRLPKVALTLADPDDEPEIPPEHHRGLLDWALFRAGSDRDADSFNLALADRALRDFEMRFGFRLTAYARRQQRDRRVHRVTPLAF